MQRDALKQSVWECTCVRSAGQLPNSCVRFLPSPYSVVALPLPPTLYHFIYLGCSGQSSESSFPSSFSLLFLASSHQETPSIQYRPQARDGCPCSCVSPLLIYKIANVLLVWQHAVCLCNGPFSFPKNPVRCVIQPGVCTSLEGEGEDCDGR